jgi:hypothetical protein
MSTGSETTPLLSVPMLDFRREFAAIREEVLAAIASVCESQRFILGPGVDRFEAAAAKACGVAHAVGCSSGTDALWLAMAALEIGPGDAVVTSPFTFFATVSSILRAGAKPVLADIDEKTFNLSSWLRTLRRRLAPPGTGFVPELWVMLLLSASIRRRTLLRSAMLAWQRQRTMPSPSGCGCCARMACASATSTTKLVGTAASIPSRRRCWR